MWLQPTAIRRGLHRGIKLGIFCRVRQTPLPGRTSFRPATSGGPTRSTYFYAMYLYENAFVFLRMGYACAMAWILFLVILGLTAMAMRFARSEA